jgi:hypothetical protein
VYGERQNRFGKGLVKGMVNDGDFYDNFVVYTTIGTLVLQNYQTFGQITRPLPNLFDEVW